MEKVTATELREVNGNFSLACLISGNLLKISEVKNLTNTELMALKSRITNERLLDRTNNEIKKRKLFRT